MTKIFIAAMAILAITAVSSAPAYAASVEDGKKLFENKKKSGCKVCHKTTAKKSVGPGLKGISSKHSDEWMKKWIKDSKAVWAGKDPETVEMKKRLKRVGKKKPKMKLKKSVKLSDDDIESLVMYLKTL